LGRHGDGEGALDGLDTAVEGELAEDHRAVECLSGDDARGTEEPHGDRQVIGGPFFAYISRREIDRDTPDGKVQARILDGGFDALAALFHRRVWQPDDGKAGESRGDIGFDLDDIGIDPQHGAGEDLGQHGLAFPPRCLLTPQARQGPDQLHASA
jgi:hypothetical protein